MKKLLLITSIAVLIIAALTVWLFSRSSTPSQSQKDSVTFPIDQQSIAAGTSATSSEKNFLSNPTVKEDPNNSGEYFIGNQPDSSHEVGDTPYLIMYTADTNYFNILLMQEPIGEIRQTAERYLTQVLNIDKDQMCALNYSVYAPNTVNSQYAGTNLGFSFCPGAVKLPQ